MDELNIAINTTKLGKAAGLDEIYPEFIRHSGPRVRQWLLTFFNEILRTTKLPASLKRSKIIAIAKPGKSPEKPENYRPIALLSINYKLLEKLMYNRLINHIQPNIPIEQAGFISGRSCCDQVLSLTTVIESGFQNKQKTSIALIDLTSAYDSVWKEGLLVKLHNMIPSSKLISLIDCLLSDRLFQVHLDGNKSKFRVLHNGLPQGSVLAPLLFNVYLADIPATTSLKFMYADDIALAAQNSSLIKTEDVLIKDLKTLEEYFSKWGLRPNPNKTEVSTFHLNHKLSNYCLNVQFQNSTLKHNPTPKYLGVTLDRTLTFKSNLQKLAAKLNTRVNLLQKLANSSWGSNTQVLRTSALSLIYSAAEYCAPVWLNSSHVHLLDTVINQAMRLITGTIKPTPIDWLPTLSNIAPANLRRQASLKSQIDKLNRNPSLPIHSYTAAIRNPNPRLKSRKPPLAQDFANFNINQEWTRQWELSRKPNDCIIEDPTERVKGFELPRKQWCQLNRIRTNHGRTNKAMYSWGYASSPQCTLCGAPEQNISHIIQECPITSFQGQLQELHDLTPEALQWLDDSTCILNL